MAFINKKIDLHFRPQLNDEQSNELFKLLMDIRQKQPEWFAGKKVANEK